MTGTQKHGRAESNCRLGYNKETGTEKQTNKLDVRITKQEHSTITKVTFISNPNYKFTVVKCLPSHTR